jgi:hypothetical protein
LSKILIMEQAAFLNINELSEEAKNELKVFYDYLLFKYGKKKSNKKTTQDARFKEFLSISLDTKNLILPGREERNER